MTIALPRFDQPYLEQLLVCGLIEPPHTDDIDWPDRDKGVSRIASYPAAQGKSAFVKLTMDWCDRSDGVLPSGLHVHLECASESYFADPPETDSSIQDIRTSIDRLLGRPLTAVFDARYALPKNRAGKKGLVRAFLKFETRVGGMDIGLVGSRFEVAAGDDLLTLDWRQDYRNDDPFLLVDLTTHRSNVLEAEIFETITELFSAAFAAVVAPRNIRSPMGGVRFERDEAAADEAGSK